MSTPLPSTLEVAESPELAILYALQATLKAAEHMLLAAHPELEDLDLSAPELLPVTPMACAADLLLLHVTAIDGAINRYTAQLRRGSAINGSAGEF